MLSSAAFQASMPPSCFLPGLAPGCLQFSETPRCVCTPFVLDGLGYDGVRWEIDRKREYSLVQGWRDWEGDSCPSWASPPPMGHAQLYSITGKWLPLFGKGYWCFPPAAGWVWGWCRQQRRLRAAWRCFVTGWSCLSAASVSPMLRAGGLQHGTVMCFLVQFCAVTASCGVIYYQHWWCAVPSGLQVKPTRNEFVYSWQIYIEIFSFKIFTYLVLCLLIFFLSVSYIIQKQQEIFFFSS